jgi:3-phosphoshikimate 1-carboxyvinyltransferase
VPGDISSAAFFMVAASIVPDSDVTITGVGINPTRNGIIEVLKEMGADIDIANKTVLNGEPVADIRIKHAPLRGAVISGDMIPRLIDEIPVLAAAGAFASGETVIRDAAELKVKETDRILAVVEELGRLGADIRELSDGMIIRPGRLQGAAINSRGDHRMAMTAAVAGLAAGGETVIEGAECINISFPGFFDLLDSLRE